MLDSFILIIQAINAPVAILIFCIVAILLFRKPLYNILKNCNTIKLPYGLEVNTNNTKSLELPEKDQVEPQALPEQKFESDPEPEINSDSPTDHWDKFIEICDMIKDKGTFAAEQSFNSFIHNAEENEIKIFKAHFLNRLFINGKKQNILEDFEKLYAECHTDEDRLTVATWWSHAYRQVEDYNKERNLLENVIGDIKDSSIITSLTINLAHSFMKTADNTKAYNLLNQYLNSIESDNERIIVYKALAEVEKKLGNKVMSAFCLEKQLEINSNNITDLFPAAYSQSTAGIQSLSLYNYNLLITLDSKSENALNNIGISFQELDFSNKAIENLKKSADLGSSLACANMGYKYLNAGFIDHAREMATKGLNCSEPHKNNHLLMEAIEKSVAKENTKLDLYKKRGYEIKQHVHKYVEAYYGDIDNKENPFAGEWLDSNGIRFQVTLESNILSSKWEKKTEKPPSPTALQLGRLTTEIEIVKFSLNGNYRNKTAQISYKGKNSVTPGILLGDPVESYESLYSYINENSDWVIFSIDLKKPFELIMKRPD